MAPVDLVPEFLPVIGPLDDVVVVALACGMRLGRSPAMFSWMRGRVRRG